MNDMDKKKAEPVEEAITLFKGFSDKWECRGFQFKIGETFHHEGKVNVCESGFHACEYPLDVFNFYPPAGSRFAVVKQSGELSRHDGDSKVASKSISIMAEINIAGLVKSAIEYTSSRCNPVDPDSPASATGMMGAASATGYQGAASATGMMGAASATGTRGVASATGEASVAAATGWNCRAQVADGCAIVLAYRNDDGKIVHIRASKVGDNGIKPDVWYELDANGQFVEAKDYGVWE